MVEKKITLEDLNKNMNSMKQEMNSMKQEMKQEMNSMKQEMKQEMNKLNYKFDNLAQRVNTLEKEKPSGIRRRKFPILQILNDSGGYPSIKI